MEEFKNTSLLRKQDNKITVKGDGMVSVRPDSASVNLGVTTESQDLVAGQQQNARDAARIIQSLLGLKIPSEKIRTFDYRIDTEYDYKDGKQIFRAYKITHILQVKIDDLEKIGRIVDAAVQNGANYVSDVQFTASNKDAIYQEALVLAVKNAIAKAETISTAINVKLDRTPFHVVEGFQQARPFYEQQTMLVKGASTTPIQPGQLIIEASITADFSYTER